MPSVMKWAMMLEGVSRRHCRVEARVGSDGQGRGASVEDADEGVVERGGLARFVQERGEPDGGCCFLAAPQ